MVEVDTPDGRTLRVHEAGDPAGLPVVYHHGSPGSGLLYGPWIEDAEARGIRLLGYDRPGYGRSTPKPGRSVADAAADVIAVADALGLGRFASWGFSGGGPHALACAALRPDRCLAVASLASVAPFVDAPGLDWYDGMGEGNVREFGAVLAGPEQHDPMLEREAEGLRSVGAGGFVEALREHLSDVDASVGAGDLGEYLHRSMLEGLEPGIAGWRDDDLAFARAWGFGPASIRVPVLLRQGVEDLMVPVGHGRWLAAQIPGVDARITNADGHLTLVEDISSIHAWLARQGADALAPG
jgi:pimeloyl-ACP methyl ester carboxylesterase